MIETKEDGRQYHVGTNLFSRQNATLQPDHQEASHLSAFRQDHSRLVVVALNEGTNDKLTHINLGCIGGNDLMLAHTMFRLGIRQSLQGSNTLAFPGARKKIPSPHGVPQATTVIDIGANPEMTEDFPVNISKLLPVTNRQLLQIRGWRDSFFINKLPVIQT